MNAILSRMFSKEEAIILVNSIKNTSVIPKFMKVIFSEEDYILLLKEINSMSKDELDKIILEFNYET